MDIFRSRYFKINVILLSLVGLWPLQKNKTWQKFQQIMDLIYTATFIAVIAARLYEIWGDLDIMIECLTPIGVGLIGSVKVISTVVYQKNMMTLLETIERDWSSLRNEKEFEIHMKCAEQGRKLTVIYSVSMYIIMFIYLMEPMAPRFLDLIIPLNESRPSQFLYPVQYYVDFEENKIWIYLHSYSSSVAILTIIISADSTFACYVLHVCGMFEVIGHRLMNLTSERSDTDNDVYIMSKDEDEKCFREIVLCIDQHYRIIEYVNVIESSYSIPYMLVLGISVILLSISAVLFLIKLGDVGEMIRLIQMNTGQIIHLLLISWPCQQLMDYSVKFRESLYAAKWYLLSEGNKHLIRFAMMRARETQKITAGKIYVMSIENFGVVIKTSISYFTVFASLQ